MLAMYDLPQLIENLPKILEIVPPLAGWFCNFGSNKSEREFCEVIFWQALKRNNGLYDLIKWKLSKRATTRTLPSFPLGSRSGTEQKVFEGNRGK